MTGPFSSPLTATVSLSAGRARPIALLLGVAAMSVGCGKGTDANTDLAPASKPSGARAAASAGSANAPKAAGSTSAATSAAPPAKPKPPPVLGPQEPAARYAELLPPLPKERHSAGPRVYAKSRFVWIHYRPDGRSGWMGYLWIGGSVPLLDPEPLPGSGACPAWYKVKPRGFVCVDGKKATLDKNDPEYVAILPFAPKLSSPWPHRYGESTDLQRYRSIPGEKEQKKREYNLKEHRSRIADALAGKDRHKTLVGVDLKSASGPLFGFKSLPPAIQEERPKIWRYSTVAWSAATHVKDRSWLLAADYAVIPKDRVRPYKISRFHGTRLGKNVKLPIAYFRKKPRPSYLLKSDGSFEKGPLTFPRHAFVQLTPESKTVDGKRYLKTKRAGVYILEDDCTVVDHRPNTPWGAPVDGKDETGKTPEGRQTWMEISVYGGWAIAYEGTKPIFATLISPGRGGIPERGKDPVETASTPVGTYPVTGKFATATMSTRPTIVHSDVPWTQNFHGPHALHMAYWHDVWGERKSGGCVNFAPIDARWLYYWTEPQVPEGWHGLRADKLAGPSTRVVVHR